MLSVTLQLQYLLVLLQALNWFVYISIHSGNGGVFFDKKSDSDLKMAKP